MAQIMDNVNKTYRIPFSLGRLFGNPKGKWKNLSGETLYRATTIGAEPVLALLKK
jgi:hypothetical protein